MILELLQASRLPARDLLGLSVVGALVTTVGALVALVLKEAVFARSFERWKSRQALAVIYQRYRDPLILAARELAGRLQEICDGDAGRYLATGILEAEPTRARNAAQDPYYFHYKFESTIYRLCAFLGWLELYRREVVFLDSGQARRNRLLQERVAALREDLAEGRLNRAEHWEHWTDALIFREEQRAIGEVMLDRSGHGVIGFGEFDRMLAPGCAPEAARWIERARHFLEGMGSAAMDFRLFRVRSLFVHLVDLMETLDRSRVPSDQRKAREVYEQELFVWPNLPGVLTPPPAPPPVPAPAIA